MLYAAVIAVVYLVVATFALGLARAASREMPPAPADLDTLHDRSVA